MLKLIKCANCGWYAYAPSLAGAHTRHCSHCYTFFSVCPQCGTRLPETENWHYVESIDKGKFPDAIIVVSKISDSVTKET